MLNIINRKPQKLSSDNPLLTNLGHIPYYLSRPVRIFKSYNRQNLRFDLVAGLTVGVITLPQAIAFALIAELPPEMGLYTAIIGAVVGGLWGSSNQAQTGPANAISLLVLSSLSVIAVPGSPDFLVAAGMLAVMAGVFQLVIGMARLGILVNFVSHSVIVGFATGAGVLIAIGQLRPLLGLNVSGENVVQTILGIVTHLPDTHWPTAALGLGTIIFIGVFKKVAPKLPDTLISMVIASAIIFFFQLDKAGVDVIGQLPSKLPPVANLPLFNLEFIARLSTGALAVGTIGLIQTIAIARAISAQTNQRLDSNQEFVGQGLANIACGVFSGYPGAGSFSRSVVSLESDARTPLTAVFSSLFVLVGMLVLAPLTAYLPRAALAGVLILTAFGMMNRAEIIRIWQGARGDALIMLVTFLGTLFLPIEFAVLAGVLLSFAHYIMKTSVPRVYPVLPDETFKHFVEQKPHQASCPQLGIIKISGDLYFGAVNHVEEALNRHLSHHPEQRFLLLRMHGVNQCDFSGIHMLETVRGLCKERGGDLFFMKVQEPVYRLMESTGFVSQLGADHFLIEEEAIGYLFYKTLDPATCIYECNVRAFKECQNLPKRTFQMHLPPVEIPAANIVEISPKELRLRLLNGGMSPLVIDVREPREFNQGHVPQAQLMPLSKIISQVPQLPHEQEIVLVCRTGRRSVRAAQILQKHGCQKVHILQGGILAWEAAGLLEAIE